MSSVSAELERVRGAQFNEHRPEFEIHHQYHCSLHTHTHAHAHTGSVRLFLYLSESLSVMSVKTDVQGKLKDRLSGSDINPHRSTPTVDVNVYSEEARRKRRRKRRR